MGAGWAQIFGQPVRKKTPVRFVRAGVFFFSHEQWCGPFSGPSLGVEEPRPPGTRDQALTG